MKIYVTQEDIDKGIKSDACDCPIALAINRTLNLPLTESVSVCQRELYLGNHLKITPPPHVSAFIEEFDRGLPVSPFSFELDYNPSNSI